MESKIILRADGNNNIGLGHVARCLALGELLRENFDVSFAISDPDPRLLPIIQKVISRLLLLKSTAESGEYMDDLVNHLAGNEIVVLDGYQFSETYEKTVKGKAVAVVTIDDIPSRHYVADSILNFCGDAVSEYSKALYTRVYAGLSYLFLRPPFLRTSFLKKEFNTRVFLNMGGSDSGNATLKVLDRLLTLLPGASIQIVVGHYYAYEESLIRVISSHPDITLHRELSAQQMHDLMCTCALAVVPPSTVSLEFISTGGLVFLHQTAANQTRLKKYLVDMQIAFDFSSWTSGELTFDVSLFEKIFARQRELVNGSSIERVKKIFRNLDLSRQLYFRKATQGDMEQCFQWSNDPEARKFSYSMDPIPWDDHVKWFTRKIVSPDCFYFIVENHGAYFGQIRFDLTEQPETFQISYSIDAQWRGKGFGQILLNKSIQQLCKYARVKSIVGYVQRKNIPSIRAFESAGFVKTPAIKYPDSYKFELSV